MSNSIPRKRIKKVAYGVSVPEYKQKKGKPKMNFEPREISLPRQHVQSAVEEYLHRLKLIDVGDYVELPDQDHFTISVRKEAVH